VVDVTHKKFTGGRPDPIESTLLPAETARMPNAAASCDHPGFHHFSGQMRTVRDRSMSAKAATRMARRRAIVRRARIRIGLAGLLAGSCLAVLSPLNLVQAAPPGSFTITSVGCPGIILDFRTSLLATGGAKSNVVHLEWSDGTTQIAIPDMVVPQAGVAKSSQSDTTEITWSAEPPSTPTPYTATATAVLYWQRGSGSTKVVATDTATRTCN
jgi:hypothetical protein